MGTKQKTVIITGASQGIGAGVVQAFLDRGYNVVATSRNITKSGAFTGSGQLVLVDGDIAESTVVAKVVETAISKFGSIDATALLSRIPPAAVTQSLQGRDRRRSCW